MENDELGERVIQPIIEMFTIAFPEDPSRWQVRSLDRFPEVGLSCLYLNTYKQALVVASGVTSMDKHVYAKVFVLVRTAPHSIQLN